MVDERHGEERIEGFAGTCRLSLVAFFTIHVEYSIYERDRAIREEARVKEGHGTKLRASVTLGSSSGAAVPL